MSDAHDTYGRPDLNRLTPERIRHYAFVALAQHEDTLDAVALVVGYLNDKWEIPEPLAMDMAYDAVMEATEMLFCTR